MRGLLGIGRPWDSAKRIDQRNPAQERGYSPKLSNPSGRVLNIVFDVPLPNIGNVALPGMPAEINPCFAESPHP
jgi:hypothetical protein